MSIIVRASVFGGLFIWLWAMYYLYFYWRGVGRVSTFILFLLLSDLLDLGVTPLMILNILGWPPYIHGDLSTLFFGTRLLALYLHQLVALESILHLRHPQYSARIASPPNSMFICLSVWVTVVFLNRICDDIEPPYFSFSVYVVLCLVPLVMAIVTCVLALTDCPINSQASSPGQGRRAAILVTTASIVTFVFVYMPVLVFTCLALYPSHLADDHPFHPVPELAWLLTTSAMCLRVMTDPLLCVLVCSQIRRQSAATTERDTLVGLQADLVSD